MINENVIQHERDAIIFVPGIGRGIDQETKGLARRIADALKWGAGTEDATFMVKTEPLDSKNIPNSNNGETEPVYTIYRKDNDKEKPLIDIYKLNYKDTLTGIFSKANPLKKAWRLFIDLLRFIPSLGRVLSPSRKEHEPLEKVQILFALSILGISLIYLVILLLAVVQTINQLIAPNTVLIPLPEFLKLFPQLIVISVAIVELFYPRIKQQISQFAVTYISVVEYFSVGSTEGIIAGQLKHLLQHLKEEKMYRNIHIIAYSFGCVVALNTLFPLEVEGLSQNTVQTVDTLVTIGYPYDVVSLFWPKYFKHRDVVSKRPRHWLNVYSPTDILGSMIRNDNKLAEPYENLSYMKIGDPDGTISLFQALSLVGLQAHMSYWGAEYKGEDCAFSSIVKKIYKDDFALS